MYISLDWLKDFVEIPKNMDPQDLGNLLTLKTAEVEEVVEESKQYENMVTGQVITLSPHPNADKLKLAKVSLGKDDVQVVCGGENLKEGMYVAVAKIGAKVRWHGEGELVTMEKAKIRGEYSEGMICASNEIGIDTPGEGPRDILDLSAIKPEPGTPLAKLIKKDDVIFEFDNKSLTHRPDLWGHYGIAREVAAITDSKFKELKPDVKIPEKEESPDVKVEDQKLCPRYCGLLIENIKIEESPDWLKKRLKATEHGTHNNIVDVTNYILTELGQPMHAFDKNYIKGGIVVRTAKKGEKITTLDYKERTLSPEMLVIADHEKPVAVAGIIGGENSEINEKTTSIILESANFDAASIRKTSVKLGVRTDSVQRFEKALDPLLAELAILRAAELILKICPKAKIVGPITDVQKFNKTPLKIDLSIEKTQSKIGVDIPKADIKKILESLQFKVAEKNANTFSVEIPSFRATKDVQIEDDLIEEVARLYGYDNIPAHLPNLPTRLPIENTERFKKHRARELFSYALGFDEVYNYSFYGKPEIKNCLLQEDGHLHLLNYLSEDQTHLRTTLIPNILKNIQHNIKYFDNFKIYEIGRTYKEIGEFMPLEEKRIAGAIVKKSKKDNLFYEAKGAVKAFFQKFQLSKIKEINEIQNTSCAHPNKAISYLDHNGETIAKVYLLHPTISKNHDLDAYSIALFEINFTEALKAPTTDKKFTPLPKFPGIEIDISVVIDRNTEIAAIEKAIRKADSLITNIKLFDIYEGENIDANKKSVAFKITLQAADRTLTDEEMSKTQKQIFTNLKKLGGEIRGI
jgi:phenylalanyl-tRNA synthetase beta chain